MKLRNVLKGVEFELISGNFDVNIDDIAYNSNNVINNSMFVALTGFMVDGHKYIDDAVNKGANVLLIEKNIDNKYDNIKMDLKSFTP